MELSESGVTSGPPAASSVDLGGVGFDEVLEEDDYADTYRCKHCGYTWTETHEKGKDLGRVEGPKEDIG